MNFFEKLKNEREEKRRKIQEALEDRVLLAEDVRRFFETDVGKHVKEKMDQDKLAILKEIQNTDPFETKTIMTLQNKYAMISRIQTYLGQAIIDGDNAYQQLQQSNNRNDEE